MYRLIKFRERIILVSYHRDTHQFFMSIQSKYKNEMNEIYRANGMNRYHISTNETSHSYCRVNMVLKKIKQICQL